jgi:hypothetical protein
LIAVSRFLNKFLLFLNHGLIIFVTSDAFAILLNIYHTAACTIAASFTHSKLDYCNSFLLILPATQSKHLQLVLNAITKTPKFHHIYPILKSLHWLKIDERIHYKVLSLTYNTCNYGHASCLHSVLSLKRNCSNARLLWSYLIVFQLILT